MKITLNQRIALMRCIITGDSGSAHRATYYSYSLKACNNKFSYVRNGCKKKKTEIDNKAKMCMRIVADTVFYYSTLFENAVEQ